MIDYESQDLDYGWLLQKAVANIASPGTWKGRNEHETKSWFST